MASEYALSLKATLDTTEVQQKIDQLNQQASQVNQVNHAPAAARDLDKLSDSLKNFRRAVGGAVIAQSLTTFAKQVQMFGEDTDKMMDQVASSFSRVMAAAATGNVALVAFVATMETFGMAAQNYARQMAEAAEALADLDKRIAQFNQFKKELADYRMESRVANVSKMTTDEQKNLLGELQDQYSKLTNKVQDALAKGAQLNAPDTKGLISELKKVESAIEKVREVMYPKKEFLEYTEGTQSYSGFGDTTQIEDELEEAFQKLQNEKPVLPTAADFKNRLGTLGGGAMSGFSASGFGMGEVSITTTISRQIDEVIRLLQDQLRKDLTVVNVDTTL